MLPRQGRAGRRASRRSPEGESETGKHEALPSPERLPPDPPDDWRRLTFNPNPHIEEPHAVFIGSFGGSSGVIPEQWRAGRRNSNRHYRSSALASFPERSPTAASYAQSNGMQSGAVLGTLSRAAV
jgi:hypothetical protein